MSPLRPASELFSQVIGQDQAVTFLKSAALRPVHSYLFVGPRGAGSRPAAVGFAAALLCPDAGCGQCETCRRALFGTHPDLVFFERTGAALSVDDARRLALLALRRPFEAGRQVLVVTDMHLAVRSAPVLLKTVEEPPPTTIFVLLADVIPPELVTIASRCAIVNFRPLTTTSIQAWLEAEHLERRRAHAIAQGAAGDLERARLLAEDTGYAERQELWRSVPRRLSGDGAAVGELVRELLNATDAALAPLRERHAHELEVLEAEAASFGERGAPRRREILERQHREERRFRGEEILAGLAVLARSYRDRMREAMSAGAGFDELDRCVRATGAIGRAAASFERNPNETLLVESLLIAIGPQD
ncbi:MAG: ATP-binding protein [Acidimicrobiales bacterium]